MKDITLIRKILNLVSYNYEDEWEKEKNYWGHDTAMNAKEIEDKAKKILATYNTSKENNND